MKPFPGYVRGVGYGDRFDADICAGLDAGLTYDATAETIGISGWFVRRRARALGYAGRFKPQLQRRHDFDAAHLRQGNGKPSKTIGSLLIGRRDEGPSRLARTLRHRVVILDRDGLDPSHGVACLHFAGLTLPEIERLTGVPAPAVIDAVRRHCAPLGANEARP